MRVLLVGPKGHGGEEVYVNSMRSNPPEDVTYAVSDDFHRGAPGARCNALGEVLLNRVVYRRTIPDIGFRMLRVGADFDLVHVHAHPNVITGLGHRPLVLSEGSSPVVYVEQYLGWDEARLRSGLRRSRRLYRTLRINDRLLAAERARRVYVFSAWARDLQIRWGADPDKLEVLYPGFPTPPEIHREERQEFVFLFVGRDFERKGGFELVEAFAQVLRARPEVRLVIAGSDPADRNPDRSIHSWVGEQRRRRVLEQLQALVEAGSAQVHQWVGRDELLNQIYPRADVFVMPPHAEGFGFTNVEAMSFGLPVVTSTVGPSAEVVSEGRTGTLVAPGDVDALTGALLDLAENRDRASEMGRAARERFLARFTLARFRTELGDLYARACES